MIGAIAGDIIGSVYEFAPIKTKEFPLFHRLARFTDDSVLTAAVARAIMDDGDYKRAVWELGREYHRAGYGESFYYWLDSADPQPYDRRSCLRPISASSPLRLTQCSPGM